MRETRANKYGRNLAIWIDYTIDTFPKNVKEDYRAEFLEELSKYSLKQRKNGQPRNEGCVYELLDLVKVNMGNPKHLAKLVKEGIHLMYQKQTSARVLSALQEYLKPKKLRK
jgi:hypothetical protein